MPTAGEVSAPKPGDEGMSLLEVMMAIFVIGTVMAAVSPFLINSVSTSVRQRTDQVSIQVANDAMERARSINPTFLSKGRGKDAAQDQWADAPAAVEKLLKQMDIAPDLTLTDGSLGAKAPLPTDPVEVVVNGTTYHQNWYVGRCFQAKAALVTVAPGAPSAPVEGRCDKGTVGVPFTRVVVAVDWTGPACPATGCLYTSSALFSIDEDPVFDTVRPPPKVTDETNTQYIYAGVPADDSFASPYQVKSTGGRLPLTWKATNLPAGVTIDPDSGVISGKPTAAAVGNYNNVVVTVTDKDGRTDDALFKFTVVNNLVLNQAANQSTRNNTNVSLALSATGGKTAYQWVANGLPPGLSINATTGVISGRTTATPGSQTHQVAVTVTDSGYPRVSKEMTFSWYVGLTIMSFTPASTPKGTTNINYDLAPLAGGGATPYTWSAINLPDGLSINAATGRVTGTMQFATRYLTTIIVTDNNGTVAKTDVLVAITASGNDMRITAPTATVMTATAGQSITAVTLTSGGSNSPSHTWTATGLPNGLSISAGKIVGTPTVPGSYRVTLRVTNAAADRAILMFDWNVT
ncbi:putative Ig domain-containing protein [Actinoplanes sp. NPDC051859]|uniref:putative Ig domain-containing protein n=1 Tax=Actinoplanes sp. NPDC051859 TaxID=3363909 RepID=UPI0037B9DC5E